MRSHSLATSARGVAVVEPTSPTPSWTDWPRIASAGLRVNFVTPQSWGVTTAEMLTTLARKVARLGWHIQVFVQPEQLVELAPVLDALPIPLVIDHMARIDPAEGAGRPQPSARCAGCSMAATPGSSCRASTCARAKAHPPTTTPFALGRALIASRAGAPRLGQRLAAHHRDIRDRQRCRPGRRAARLVRATTAVCDRILVDNPATALRLRRRLSARPAITLRHRCRDGDPVFLLQAPQVRELEMFTRMPEALPPRQSAASWADANRGGQVDRLLPRRPGVRRRGQPVRDRHSVRPHLPHRPGGEWTQVAEYDGEPNGMKFLDDAHAARHRLQERPDARATCERARSRRYLQRRNTERFKGVNDLVFDSRGNLYFTDQGQTGLHDPTGRLYRLRPGRAARPAAVQRARARTAWRCRPTASVLYLARDARQLRLARAAAGRRQRGQGEPVLHVVRAQRPGRPGGRHAGPA